MSGTSRREFLGGASALLSALGWEGCASLPERGETLPGWRPGELDLHFIYTGCGENMFYRLPDGTAILNDTGDFYRPKELAEVPLLPSAERLGGEWVDRYVSRVYAERKIDYAVFTHWHWDHVGHAEFDRPATSDEAFRHRVTSDGRKINGCLCVAEHHEFGTVFDHQYPERDTYGSADTSIRLLAPWVEERRRRGEVRVEPFRVGALDQIAMTRDPEKFRGVFSIRNLHANGKVWDGRDGVRDFAAEYVRISGETHVPQNALSLGFVMRYGKFGFYAGGDLRNENYPDGRGGVVNDEAYLGRVMGPVTVCKMGHHGAADAMSVEFVRAVRAKVYVACMWGRTQANPASLTRIVEGSRQTGERPLILPQVVTSLQRQWAEAAGWEFPHKGAVHVVVKVEPGGGAYRVYLVDARDEGMRVVAKFNGVS